jgi:hypothetical protein
MYVLDVTNPYIEGLTPGDEIVEIHKQRIVQATAQDVAMIIQRTPVRTISSISRISSTRQYQK